MNKDETIAGIRTLKQQRASAATDRDAMAARVANIRALMQDLGAAPTATKLLAFTKTLKTIIDASK